MLYFAQALSDRPPLRDVQIAVHHADPHTTTTVDDRRRQDSTAHAAYAVVAFVTNR